MLSRCAWIARPQFLSLATRSFSSAGSSGAASGGKGGGKADSRGAAATPSSPKTTKEERAEKMDQIMKPFTKDGSDPVLENSQYTHRFFPMDTYHPAELDEGNARKPIDFHRRSRVATDPFQKLGIDPLKEYKNSLVLSTFVTDMGRIKPRHKTGLSAKSQRRVAKAIRRARSFGLIPVTSKLDAQANYRSLGRGGSMM